MTEYHKIKGYHPQKSTQLVEVFFCENRYRVNPLFRLLLCLTLLLMLPVFCRLPGFCEGTARSSEESQREFVDPVTDPDRYSAVLYNNTNGLPTSEANAIAETSDGFLWIGSYSGLVRYDGSSFLHIDSTSGITGVISLFVDSGERLWIGTNDNGVALMERGKLKLWGLADGLPSVKISAIAEDSDGVIYVGTTEGIVTVDRELNLRDLGEAKLAGIYVGNLRVGNNGMVYGISITDDVFVLSGGELVNFLHGDKNTVKGILSLLPDEDHAGYVYLGTEGSILFYGDLSDDFQTLKKYDVSPLSNIIGIDRIDGKLWVCATNGIGVLDSDGLHVLEHLPMDNNVEHVMADYEGNLWFTSKRQGVMKIVPNRFSDLFARYHLPDMVVNSTCIYDGLLFLATDTGLIVLGDEIPIQELPLTKAETASGADLEAGDLLDMLAGVRIRSIIRDSRDRLWFSTWGSYSLIRYDHGEILSFGTDDGLLSDRVRTVCEREDGSILVALAGGVCVIEGDRVTASYGKEDGVVNTETLTVSAAENGDILLGTNGDGIYVISDNGTRHLSYEDGLSSGIVMRIKRDAKRDLYWLVTSNSIAYMTSDYRVTTIRNFPYSNNFDLYESDNGDMWILSSNGIYVLPTEELLADTDISPVHYSLANGLSSVATSNSYSELTADGVLYIAGNCGVAKVNINLPIEPVSSLKVTVPYLEADGVRTYANENGIFFLPHSVHKLTIYSYVFNYSLSDPIVSYQLQGFDLTPTTVNRKDLGPVVYTNLSGGSYEFVLEIKDLLGHVSKPFSVQIVKAKAIYEQSAFYIACTLAAAFLLGFLFKLYIRRKTSSMEARHREVVEQERLNTELKMANRIQSSMLPHTFPPFPDRTEFNIYASMDPAKEVGGDFYDFFLIDDDYLCLVIADVSGKGIPASLFMMITKVIMQSCAMLGKSPEEILTKTNTALCSSNQVDMFVTAWVGVLEISTGRLLAANAGHEYPILQKDGIFSLLRDKHAFVMGGLDDICYHEYELWLEAGDKIFLYTDGVTEATDPEGTMFGTDRILTVLNEDPSAAPQEILRHVRSAVDSFVRDAEQFDDLTMLCMEYRGTSKPDSQTC